MSPSIDSSKLKIQCFKNFGIYKIYNKQLNLFIVCKDKTNFFYSGHAHDDNLSIDVQNGIKNIITDPGSTKLWKKYKIKKNYTEVVSLISYLG